MAIPTIFKALTSAILPPGIERSLGSGLPKGQIEGQSFADLLAMEKTGSLGSARGVSVRPEAGVNLSSEQMARLGVAMDRAEASGAQNALIMLDGMALKVNVGVRQVTEQVDIANTQVASGIDAVINAGDTRKGKPATLSMPGAGVHPSIAKILEGSQQSAA